MRKFPYPYDLNGNLVTGNGSLIPICSLPNRSLSNRSILPSLTVLYAGPPGTYDEISTGPHHY